MRKEKIKELREYVNELKTIKKVLVPSDYTLDANNNLQRQGFLNIEKYMCYLQNGNIIPREKIIKGKKEGDAAIIVPITEEKNILFVIQPRCNTKETVCIELPAGYIEKDEEPIIAAKRELLEETGYIPKKIYPLASYYQDQGCSGAYNYSFLALDCKKEQKQNLDKDEFIKYFECNIDEALELLEKGYITDIQSQYALEKSKQYILKNKNNIKQLIKL